MACSTSACASRVAPRFAPTASSRGVASRRSGFDGSRHRAPSIASPSFVGAATARRRRRANVTSSRGSLVVSAAGKGTKVIVQGIHLEITDSIKEYAETKINKAVSHFDMHDVREVDIRCSARGGEKQLGGDVQKTEVTVYTKNGTIRAEEEAEDLYAAIDLVSDKLERKMRKVKEKKNSKMAAHNKNNPREATAAAVEEAMLAEEAEEDVPAS